mmetsp:Transcript_14797/g.22415  ORF Transcript_14797/g.22415 Transcript_14797/m.22415 type:complete len:394 (-) Transcript_14797:156-1337(-)|eukprot:CAMPEP_0203681406 /NCGR_PEP_ID=MMETSP0090-20130426/42616_1 /ASSEMBLY_ACC=CAM_ASM_001088 /TAXON_ID=426623 /ORGANISM="Chaetoceros affinis, Strain CCMP159" /LENGTH=393 /DNA_ID=CAMNT_0050549875 /DNA_START=181 /DNA_END=1362 /DNA_ORIENTATION=+
MNQYLQPSSAIGKERRGASDSKKALCLKVVIALAVLVALGENIRRMSTTIKCVSKNSSTIIEPSAVPETDIEPEHETNDEEEKESDQIHLRDVQAADRDLNGITVDITYNLNVPPTWYDGFPTTSPSYNETMVNLHGYNIWEDEDTLEKGEEEITAEGDEVQQQQQQPKLSSFLEFLQLSDPPYKMIGSPMDRKVLFELLKEVKPKIFLEVGVFHGMTSTTVAKYFQSHDGFEDSYVLSMDSWLLDLRFTWNGFKSKHVQETKTADYFIGTSKAQGGYSTMYYHFLANCIKTQTTDRIVPLPTAAQNGAMTLLSHGIRPDFIYLDASHSNPDVYIDYENFYTILKPGGVMAFDDTGIPAVRAAFDALIKKYDLKVAYETRKQAHIFKVKEKYE